MDGIIVMSVGGPLPPGLEGLKDLLGGSEQLVEHMQKHVEECRKGDYDQANCLISCIKAGAVSLEDLGITEEELKGLCKQADVEVGKEVVEECRKGDYRNLVVVMGGLDEDRFTPEDLGTSEQELGGFLFKRRMGPMVSGNGATPTSEPEPAEQSS